MWFASVISSEGSRPANSKKRFGCLNPGKRLARLQRQAKSAIGGRPHLPLHRHLPPGCQRPNSLAGSQELRATGLGTGSLHQREWSHPWKPELASAETSSEEYGWKPRD
jgi:hypothetical protein